MDILELAGFSKWMAREISLWLAQRLYARKVQMRRFKMICRDEVKALLDPDSVDPIASIYYPWVCGTFLSRMRVGVKLDSDKMDEIPVSALPYLTRILRGAKFLKNYMDIGKLKPDMLYALMRFMGFEKDAPNYCSVDTERFEFSQEDARELADGIQKDCDIPDDDFDPDTDLDVGSSDGEDE